jgi:hypothetical protein
MDVMELRELSRNKTKTVNFMENPKIIAMLDEELKKNEMIRSEFLSDCIYKYLISKGRLS